MYLLCMYADMYSYTHTHTKRTGCAGWSRTRWPAVRVMTAMLKVITLGSLRDSVAYVFVCVCARAYIERSICIDIYIDV